MIELRNVKKEYSKGNAALNGVSVKIERGEFVFIVGDSGSGKSTLIRLIMKELNPTDGTIIVNGQNLNRMRHRNIAKYRRGLGVVFQDFRLLKDRNIYENIAFALRVTETPGKVIKKKVPAALSLVGLAQKYKSFPKELSGGEQQRVAIARAIVNEPAILLADEPTGNLDPTNSWEIMSLLKEANERGTTVLVVTHNQEIVNEMNERVITMKQGVIVSDERKGGYTDVISTIGYVGKQGVKSIWRNKMFSLASLATMSACIFLFGLFFSILVNFQYIIRSAEEGVAITVFFDEEATDEQIQKIGEELKARDDVSEVKYISAEQAWEDFQKDYFGDNLELAEGFKDDNPLANSDNYEVYMKTTDNSQDLIARSKSLSSTQQDLVKFAQSLDGVSKVNKSDVVANTLSSVNMLVAYISIAIIAILLGVSIFLISNTVTMGITVRKEEIAIMKYIGAKDFVVRSPFVIEGLIIGIFGAAIPLGLLYVLYDKAVSYVMERFSILKNIIDFLPVNVVYTYLLPIGLIMGIGIGFLGSFFTVRKHLRV